MVRAGDSNSNKSQKKSKTAPKEGLTVEQIFSSADENPFDQVCWEKRSAKITGDKGEVIFEQNDAEIPVDWSQIATKVVVSKYFYGEPGTDERENSVRQLVNRVSRTITDWGKKDGVFASDEDAERFYNELTYLCVNQYGAFNSPTWFNVGLYQQNEIDSGDGHFFWDPKTESVKQASCAYEYPQASACFIQSVDDNMEDIMRLASQEAFLFKHGSGTGTDLSTIRSSREKLSGGGSPSGPLSFMRVYDQVAAVVKSGGKTRRAAKMQSLRIDHPDVLEFIECKTIEEKKAWALIEQGYDGSFNGDAYSSVMFQNANLSVRVTDDFMQSVLDDQDWETVSVTTGEGNIKYPARELLRKIAEGTHVCGDPGVQYHTTINRWHTCPESGEIRASNPCSEYMFVDDSACNLASLNLMKFRNEDGSFDVERFQAAVRIFIIAQEIIVDNASYPSDRICENSHKFRPLGLGYANLGALIMSLGLPYDGNTGRAYAAAITAIMTGTAYCASSELAKTCGTFTDYDLNKDSMMRVIKMHREAVGSINEKYCLGELIHAAEKCWNDAVKLGEQNGYRNAQVSVLAPTGTIGFMMDCDTTGIEPDIALVKYKNLAGGGMFKIVNQTVPQALQQLGYSKDEIGQIIEYIDEKDTIEGAPGLKEEHLSVFDCAFKAANGTRTIGYMGHVRMMAAVQPFLSGAISKTVNMPHEATVDEIMEVYVEAWKQGLKAVAIYRDGSKRTQPLNTSMSDKEAEKIIDDVLQITPEQLEQAKRTPHRRKLPATRPSLTHKFDVAGHEGYLTVGLFEDGKPGELFVSMAKEGSTVGGMMDVFATSTSLCLQYGVPLPALIKKFTHQRFEPSGMTSNRDIPFAKSIVDYIFRWLELTFLEDAEKNNPYSTSTTSSPKKKTDSASRKPTKAAPEAVKDDASSEPGRVQQASRKEARTSADALFTGSKDASKGQPAVGTLDGTAVRLAPAKISRVDEQFSHFQADAPPCPTCGSITVRNGSCYKCFNCGASLGCS